MTVLLSILTITLIIGLVLQIIYYCKYINILDEGSGIYTSSIACVFVTTFVMIILSLSLLSKSPEIESKPESKPEHIEVYDNPNAYIIINKDTIILKIK